MQSTTHFILARHLVCGPLYAFFLRGTWFMVHCMPSACSALSFIVHCTPSSCATLGYGPLIIIARHLVYGPLQAFLLRNTRSVDLCTPLSCAALGLWTTSRLLLARRLVHGSLHLILARHFVCDPLRVLFSSGTWFVVHCASSTSRATLGVWSTARLRFAQHLVHGPLYAFLLRGAWFPIYSTPFSCESLG
jgi:hypothetical protein